MRPHRRQPTSSSIHGILQARALEWGATAFSSVKVQQWTKWREPLPSRVTQRALSWGKGHRALWAPAATGPWLLADSFSASSRLIHSLINFYRAPAEFASNQAGSRHIVGMIQTPKEFCVENDRVNKALLIVMVFQPQHYWHFGQGNSLLGEHCSEGVSQHPWPRPTKCSCDPLAQLWQPQMSLDITKCLLGGKNHPWLKTTAI